MAAAAPGSANERLHDELTAHAVALVRYSNGEVRRIIALLNRTDADLFAQLSAALERLPLSEFSVERLEGLLTSVRSINAAAYAQVGSAIETGLRELAEYEAGYQFQLFASVVPPQAIASAGVAEVAVAQAYAAALARPFQGRLLREWASAMGERRMLRIRDAVRIGYTSQETIPQIVQRIRGTRGARYADGLIEIDRREAEAVVRTAVSHTASTVREQFYAANLDLVKAITWSSTLDTRTSEICRIRDGTMWTASEPHKPLGHKYTWLGGPGRAHWQCRSSSVPVLKSWAELGVNIGELPASTRASMDGQVPEDTTFATWLRKQSAARQDDILGPTRGALFRRGGLSLDRFYNEKGRYLTLDEMRERDAAAFRRAGL